MISAIIPFYHGNKYMKKLLTVLEKNSFILQKAKQQLEVVIVNDSPDDHVDIDTSKFDLLIRVFNNKKNVGIHQSRVNGLRECKGEYVFFLDQDDLVADDYVISQYTCIADKGFVISNGYLMDRDGNKEVRYTSLRQHNACLSLRYHYGYTNPILSPGQVLIKTSAIPEEWKEECFVTNGADDHYLWLLLLERGVTGVINPAKIYIHIYTGENTSLDIKKMWKSNQELIQKMKGKTARVNLFLLKRRSNYYGNYKDSILYKIRYFDVGICRLVFSKLF